MKGCYTIQSCKNYMLKHRLLPTNQNPNTCFTQFQVPLTLAAPTTVSHAVPLTQIVLVRNVPNSLLQSLFGVRRTPMNAWMFSGDKSTSHNQSGHTPVLFCFFYSLHLSYFLNVHFMSPTLSELYSNCMV